ncbi:MAG: dihydrodipicolinate synthase family protein [Acidobacteriota bacterium]|nr:dihydrodipicolinate synthase family protein [Acidobacteriota bacterium]
METTRREGPGLLTRREAVGLMGGAVAVTAAMLSGVRPAFGATRNIGSKIKTLMWPASVTPCDKNRKFDSAAFVDILQWFKHNGADGVVVLGTTGEFPSFSVAERRLVAETALKNKLGMNIIINPGTPNLPETLELARHAAEHGADGLLVIPPFYYNNPPVEGLTQYYSALFDEVHIPINLYHIPRTSGVPISTQLLKNLMHYPNLAGIKDSDGNMPEYEAFVADFPELNMRTGTLSKLEYALDHGMGAILMEGNLFCKQLSEVFAAYHAGKDYHAPLAKMRAAEALLREGGVYSYGPMKYALSLQMGVPQTYQRPPFVDVTDAQKAAIKAGLAKMKEMS